MGTAETHTGGGGGGGTLSTVAALEEELVAEGGGGGGTVKLFAGGKVAFGGAEKSLVAAEAGGGGGAGATVPFAALLAGGTTFWTLLAALVPEVDADLTAAAAATSAVVVGWLGVSSGVSSLSSLLLGSLTYVPDTVGYAVEYRSTGDPWPLGSLKEILFIAEIVSKCSGACGAGAWNGRRGEVCLALVAGVDIGLNSASSASSSGSPGFRDASEVKMLSRLLFDFSGPRLLRLTALPSTMYLKLGEC